jgi:hypothetical protein
MAVDAPDIALRDLFEDGPCVSSTEHDRDRHHLVRAVDMIELEQPNVCLAAVDARVRAEVFVHEGDLVVALPSRLSRRPRDVLVSVPDVVLAP